MLKTFLILAATFLLPRVFIAFFVPPYVSDIALYQQVAIVALAAGKTAYLDFAFPYPPLSLPWIYASAFLGLDYESYRLGFHLISLLIDAATHLLLFRICVGPLGLKSKKVIQAFAWSSAFALLQQNLVYDRLDLGVAFFILLLLQRVLTQPHRVRINLLLAVVGAWFKFVPGIFSPLLISTDNSQTTRKKARSLVLLAIAAGLAFLTLTWTYDWAIGGGLFASLSDHVERGIQIESVWATPFLIAGGFFSSDFGILTNYGAQHLSSEIVPGAYSFFSKTMGWVALGGYFLHQIFFKPKPDAQMRLFQFASVILIFLCSQRVLSPQFFVWLAPFAAIICSLPGHRVEKSLFLAVYALTYVEFDLGYWELVKLNPVFVAAVSARNLCLLALTWRVATRTIRPVSR